MNKKIYFAGSIRGGRADAELYRRMIAFMQQTDTVLTEHIGNPEMNLLERTPGSDAAIYERDMNWLRSADIIIAECSNPSLGVGYELARGEEFSIPCHIFYNSSRCSLSAMLGGDPYFTVHPYESEEELFSALEDILR